jgi:hypothetical protein
MFKGKLLVCLLILMLAGLSCAIPSTAAPAATAAIIPSPALAGIDMPKDGDVIPLAPYEIVYHGSDFTEVTQLELGINSVPVTIQANPAPGTGFVLLRHIWTPPTAGSYIIQTRAQNQKGEWGPYSYITITVEAPVDQIQPTPETTPEPTEDLFNPIIFTEMAPTMNLGGDGVFTSIAKSEDWIYFGESGCGPQQVSFAVSIFNFTGIRYVYMFVRVVDRFTGEQGDWNDGKAMTATKSGTYVVTITVGDIPQFSKFDEASIWYQIVIQKPDGGFVRSNVYHDITLVKCK